MIAAGPIDRAERALRAGRLVVYPTDTLLGLGARALDPGAVDRLLRAKARSARVPLSFAVSSYEEVEPWAELDAASRTEIRHRLPGPYTLLLPASAAARRSLAPGLVSAEGKVGVRIPDHPVARELARRVGPVVSTSANRHGVPPSRSIAEARAAFGREVAAYLPAVPPPSGRPSEIVDLAGARRRVTRRS